VFTARYALSPYIKQIGFVFKGLRSSIIKNDRAEYSSRPSSGFHTIMVPSDWYKVLRSNIFLRGASDPRHLRRCSYVNGSTFLRSFDPRASFPTRMPSPLVSLCTGLPVQHVSDVAKRDHFPVVGPRGPHVADWSLRSVTQHQQCPTSTAACAVLPRPLRQRGLINGAHEQVMTANYRQKSFRFFVTVNTLFPTPSGRVV
jgi:hypothetical protein